MSTTESKLTELFLDAINWGRTYGQRLNISDLALSDAAEGFSDQARAALALPASSGAEPHPDTEDAERYRWLRARPLDDDEIYIAVDSAAVPGRWALGGTDPAGCDAAIDRAMAQAEAAKGASHG